MKTRFLLFVAFFAFAAVFTSCTKDNPENPTSQGSTYVLNYGAYNGANGSISMLNTDADSLYNNYYKAVNNTSLGSNPQYMYNYNGNVYILNNTPDQISWVDSKTFKQSTNAVSTEIIKPRCCVANGDILYISCWGGDVWTDASVSYIAKFNIKTQTVTGTISLAGGPEGLEIANGKLYVALDYDNKIAVINLTDESVSYIETPAASSYFIKDNSNNLYVSLVSSYYATCTKTGLGYINTNNNTLTVYELADISESYVNMMAFNSNQSKLYVMKSAYDDNGQIWGEVAVFDIAKKQFESQPIIKNISGINGISVYPNTDNLICFTAESVTSSGQMHTYNSQGTLLKSYKTGLAPFMLLTVK